ncbi:cytochrome c biogenesis protein ResB [Roseateles sp. BYS180W]|uniref:Cytochrome c biogenesis protein ResB n=1 Tax=Roseateles rivi TaxID=3299028 RepID=A0ABW7FRR5_9BURK
MSADSAQEPSLPPPSAEAALGQSAKRSPRRPLATEAYELLTSMRFAIALLTVICIASVIGTVVKQREPLNNYVNQFGPFWSEVFGRLDIYTVYSAWWFVLILGFLVLSTSLCVARHTPKIIKELRSYKEHVREQSLQAQPHKALGHVAVHPDQAVAHVSQWLADRGWKARAQLRKTGIMVGARKGMGHKIGYLATHSAIVLVCLGGLMDGDLFVKALTWLQGKQVYAGAGLISEVPPQHRLSAGTPSYRGNLLVPEGGRAATAILSMPNGVLLQELPFDVELKKFHVEYYSTGMPKLFASDIIITDHDTGRQRSATVKVNHPVEHRGITLYQSSFDDGGSRLKLMARSLTQTQDEPLSATVGANAQLGAQAPDLTLELSGLRVMNVEDFSSSNTAEPERKNLSQQLDRHLGSGASTERNKHLRNVGPSFSYRLRDSAGQAREYNNYMQPVEIDGARVLLAGVRDTPNENFRYLRIPVDERDSIEPWLAMRRGLADTATRELAARRYALSAVPKESPQMLPQLQATALRAMTLFAGRPAQAGSDPQGGLPALQQFIEAEVPQAERERVSGVLLRILNGSLFELYKVVREQANLSAPAQDALTQAFMTQAVLSLSDAMYYPAPVLMQLDTFEQVQASVFQVTRSPGQAMVYLGAVLLCVGVLAMLYIRDRRLWLWLEPCPNQPEQTRVRMALSATRDGPDVAQEFQQLQAELLGEPTPAKEPA